MLDSPTGGCEDAGAARLRPVGPRHAASFAATRLEIGAGWTRDRPEIATGRPDIELRTIVAVGPRGSTEQADLLVRLPVEDAGWAGTLPVTPRGTTVTVTVGHPDLMPVSLATTCAHGYRVVGVASATRPIGSTVDIMVPESLRLANPDWFDDIVHRAVRVFDLRLGPVQAVLGAQLALHLRPAG